MLKLFHLPPFPHYYVPMAFRAADILCVSGQNSPSKTCFFLHEVLLFPSQNHSLLTLTFFILLVFITTWHVLYSVVCGPTSPTRLWRSIQSLHHTGFNCKIIHQTLSGKQSQVTDLLWQHFIKLNFIKQNHFGSEQGMPLIHFLNPQNIGFSASNTTTIILPK